ncbi:hypothetical protein C8D92_105230 [Tamilnaduibacter salinus]|uniref:Cytokinin riboside 5'-monophosphate phosphoribohydrolase n=1 Tax=Tamilnaduibacter salinus TaxID=1484056 RepID=A0A2U1CWX9_9GAMM|nr:TIGR00730 family Rossman fold protein [Tamilnaduibacter salinus]PVY76477.1 hypothetical protein C8D92_105230 [Tamilnaduibacter salinus]
MNIAVFCGSSEGHDAVYRLEAERLGSWLAGAGVHLVFGGGRVGLMGAIADAVLAGGGEVTGVIPASLAEKEIAHEGLTDLKVVPDMHTRKATMAQLADAFIAMPGGAGTLEELFEVWTWAQLGYHGKACALFNVNGYYDPLLSFVEGMTDAGFLWPDHRDMLLVESDPASLVERIRTYRAPVGKWQSG